jgi:Ni2+-binding GTPase involved in maturation of urease and hydrogenase
MRIDLCSGKAQIIDNFIREVEKSYHPKEMKNDVQSENKPYYINKEESIEISESCSFEQILIEKLTKKKS